MRLSWDTLEPRGSAARCVRGMTHAELKGRTGCPDSLRECLDADVWPPALEWAGFIVEREEHEREDASSQG